MPALILTLTILGLGLLWLARRRRMASGLPSGRLIYLDAGQLGRVDDGKILNAKLGQHLLN